VSWKFYNQYGALKITRMLPLSYVAFGTFGGYVIPYNSGVHYASVVLTWDFIDDVQGSDITVVSGGSTDIVLNSPGVYFAGCWAKLVNQTAMSPNLEWALIPGFSEEPSYPNIEYNFGGSSRVLPTNTGTAHGPYCDYVAPYIYVAPSNAPMTLTWTITGWACTVDQNLDLATGIVAYLG
jgi:hypothetical protein